MYISYSSYFISPYILPFDHLVITNKYMYRIQYNHHALHHHYDVSFIYVAVITLGFEQEVYFFSEQDLVANICVALLNGAVSRVVPFEVHTNLGNASGKEL